jgi:hypothetical protein
MYRIKIVNGKAAKTSWDSDIREHVTKEIDSLVPYLDCPIEIEETTFGQFFAFIEKDLDFYNVAYRSATYGHPINPFVDELHKSGKPNDLDYVEVYWGCDMDDGVMTDYPGFHGWGTWTAENALDQPAMKGGFAIEFTPLCDYKTALLKLDSDYQIHDDNFKLLLKTKKGFRVHDVIRAILYEITWAGDISKGREEPFGEHSAFKGLKS